MSAYSETKSDFLRAACQAGWLAPADVTGPWQEIPAHILRRWFGQLAQPIVIDPANPQRLLNHFKLGADPEFVFLSPDGERTDARNFGMKAALAWGADNNGRLCEIRPAPNRHALAVATSIWATLWWMHKFLPSSLQYIWRSGAWAASDGLGGHVHFGRKRPSWQREIQALDTLAFWLQHINIFNQAEWRERIRRTRGHGNYGQLSDRRTQAHGWEYRTVPSWLDSPWLAFAVLTFSKLAVFDPEFFPQLSLTTAEESAASVRAKLRGILAYFKGRDDDAALAHQILSRHGWPHFDTSDFKSRWGIFNRAGISPSPVAVEFTVPTMVPVTRGMIAEFAKSLIEARIPEWPEGPPTWSPANLPAGYMQAIHDIETYHHPGIGEIVRELVVSSGAKRIRLAVSSNARLDVPSPLLPRPVDKWLKSVQEKYPSLNISRYTPERGNPETWRIFIPTDAHAQLDRKAAVEFLTSGWAPVWKLGEVKLDSFGAWESSRRIEARTARRTKPPKPASQAIFPTTPVAEPRKKAKSPTYAELVEANRRNGGGTFERVEVAQPLPLPASSLRQWAYLDERTRAIREIPIPDWVLPENVSRYANEAIAAQRAADIQAADDQMRVAQQAAQPQTGTRVTYTTGGNIDWSNTELWNPNPLLRRR